MSDVCVLCGHEGLSRVYSCHSPSDCWLTENVWKLGEGGACWLCVGVCGIIYVSAAVSML